MIIGAGRPTTVDYPSTTPSDSYSAVPNELALCHG